MEPIRNLRAVIREKNLDLDQIARASGVQRSTLELIMIGVYVPDGDMKIKIAEALNEPPDNELWESGLRSHKPPLK